LISCVKPLGTRQYIASRSGIQENEEKGLRDII
jgi:hypothetical protein